MSSDNIPLSTPASAATTAALTTYPAQIHPSSNSTGEWRGSMLTTVSQSADRSSDREGATADDAIARHQPRAPPHSPTYLENVLSLDSQQSQHTQSPPHSPQLSISRRSSGSWHYDNEEVNYSTVTSRTGRPRSHTVPVPIRTVSFKLPPHRNLSNRELHVTCDVYDDADSTAFAEEEAALEHAIALAAAKDAAKAAKANKGSPYGVGAGTGLTTGEASGGGAAAQVSTGTGTHAEEEGEGNGQEPVDEDDSFFSGICLPRSQFFQTSVVCSNTMTRDGLANERTFLSWLGVCVALSLVSFTFITRAFTLDSVINQDRKVKSKDRISVAVGYVCFVAANLASIYSLLKYLRNIRRISTRYPFAQAGPWTFTVGMVLGTLIMVALVLAYTDSI